MPFYRIQQTFQGVSGVPQDRYVNDFAIFFPALPSPSEWTDIFAAFIDFYDVDHAPSTTKIADYFSQAISEGPHVIKAYELETPPPHLPLASASWSLTDELSGTSLPEEVAVVLSFHGDITAGTDVGPGPHLPARHRNRIYLGPLNTATMGFAESGTRPLNVFADAVLNAATFLFGAIAAIDPAAYWAIWSPTRADGEAVRGGWVDNAFDTQRRRGAESTSRRFFGTTP